MDYGRAIRIVRTAYGLTQAELAERLSVGSSQLSLIESGRHQPSVKVLDEVSVALAVPPHLMSLLASGPRTSRIREAHPRSRNLRKRC
jgi:transcriptional regulator with XRE-family HTH domain